MSHLPDEGNVGVFVLPTDFNVLDDWNDVTARQEIDETVEKHFLDFKLGQNLERFVASLEEVDEQLERVYRGIKIEARRTLVRLMI